MADRLIVMNAGYAEQVDSPMAVYESPASLFVAGFIGSPAMNFLAAEVAEGGLALAGGGRIDLSNGSPASVGRRLTLGVRPEHLHPAAENAAALRMKVQMVETLGADILAHGAVAGTEKVGENLTLRLPGTASVREGEILPLAADPGALHLFDPASGRRIADI